MTLLLAGAGERGVGMFAEDRAGEPEAHAAPGAAIEVGAEQPLGAGVAGACTGLGARVLGCALGDPGSPDFEQAVERTAQAAVERAMSQRAGVDVLVVDAASVFAGGAQPGLRACLDASWNVTRAVANAAFLPAGRGGRVVYLAPPAGAGPHAEAACAGLENLARTLSIEWARHCVTTTAIAPGGGRDAAMQAAALTAYLASPAGAYFSGCLLDLRGPARG